MTTSTAASSLTSEDLPRWSVADVHPSLDSRSFTSAMEQAGAEAARLVALFDEQDIRAVAPRPVTPADGATADRVISAMNAAQRQIQELSSYVTAFVSTNTYHEQAQAIAHQLRSLNADVSPLVSRMVEWFAALGVDALAGVSPETAEHLGPLRQLALRAEHQMSEAEEGLYAELSQTGSTAWMRLHADVTSQLHGAVAMPDGGTQRLPIAAVRGLANDSDPQVRQAAYDAEMQAWPTVAVVCAAAMNSVKGEANAVNRRRNWVSPLEASLYGNNVSRPTFDAMQAAVRDSLGDFRRWMRAKARLHGDADTGLRWRDLVAPLPGASSRVSWDEGLDIVRKAFASYGGSLGGLVDRAVGEQWMDAAPRDGKQGGAFCMSFVSDRSLVFLNWNGSLDSTQTTAHELGHAYHNTQLADRTPLQRRLPMALAETASIFCETLVVDEGLQRLQGAERLALLDVDLQGANQVVVDIHSRFLFETEVFARRERRALGVSELNEIMLGAQAQAYGDGLDHSTAHPYMWAVKGHYYGSHFYNWPYTYGLLFGLGLFARYRSDPERFRSGYDDLLSRVGMNTAEELGRDFDIDVTDESFWTASLDVLRARIAEYEQLATAQS